MIERVFNIFRDEYDFKIDLALTEKSFRKQLEIVDKSSVRNRFVSMKPDVE